MAGFRPNVAEEMTGDETAPAKESIREPEAKAQPSGDVISDAQRKRFYAIWKGAGKTPEAVKAKLLETIGAEDSAMIPKSKYEDLCIWAGAAA